MTKPEPLSSQAKAKACLAIFGVWTNKELSLLYTLRRRGIEPSEKQAAWLDDLHARSLRVRLEGVRAA